MVELADLPRSDGREAKFAPVRRDIVAGEWREVLGAVPASDDVDFFAAGGDDERAARLHANLEAIFRRQIPFEQLFGQPTIASMSSLIGGATWPLRPEPAIAIASGGTQPPLFCLAAPEVDASAYALMARRLPPAQPIYVIQSPPPAATPVKTTIDELTTLATCYLQVIRDVQPTGPYRLFGGSFGAHLAVDIARRLVARGDAVSFVGILDTWSYYTVTRLYGVRKLLRRTRWYTRRLHELARSPSAALARTHTRARAATKPAAAAAVPAGWASKRIERDKYPGEVTVFRVARHNQAFWRTRDATLGWGTEAASVRIVILPGATHRTLAFEPHVTNLAGAVGSALDETRATHDRPGTACFQ